MTALSEVHVGQKRLGITDLVHEDHPNHEFTGKSNQMTSRYRVPHRIQSNQKADGITTTAYSVGENISFISINTTWSTTSEINFHAGCPQVISFFDFQ